MVSPAEVDAAKPDAQITLHWLEKSRAQRILWLLEELNLTYDIKTYKRGSDMLAGPELKKIHPLGKSPVISLKTPSMASELVLAESAAIVEYLTEHFGKSLLLPKQWQEGCEGQVGKETAEWLRYRYFMHYAEGSLMPLLIMTLLVLKIKETPVPFFIKPITKRVASGIEDAFLTRNVELQFTYLEQQLKTSGGDWICGDQLTGADIMLSYPLETAIGPRTGLDAKKFPAIVAYVERIHARPAYQKAIQRVKDETGGYDPNLV